MSEEASDKILEKIRRLLALSTSSNEFEAVAAASKAQELLLKYNLEISQIKQAVEDEVERWDVSTPLIEPWLSSLMSCVARSNLCRVVQGKGYEEGQREGATFKPGQEVRLFYMFGKKPNLEVATYMYSFLASEIDRLTPRGKGSKYVRGFRMGCVVTISERLRKDLQTFQSTEQTRALIVVSDKALDTMVKQHFPNTVAGRGSSISDQGAFRDGQAAGRSIQFHQGVAAKNPAGQGLLR